MELLRDPETWVAIAFVIFVCFLGYLGVHNMVSKALDDRAGRIGEAERLATEAKTRIEDFVTRRTALAETKIAQAEAQAAADVRSIAAEAAVAAAEKILSVEAKGKLAGELLTKGIEDVRKKLN